eukprot:TRINITY_DN14437_c0_g1_i10.p2 TRINITY_DN14437_c0_g1~~TRINITY_DN14437_c0_g1_i10.p2  ORF type:complete len:163 (-),score=6.17 TRINITY_DN14437_c0_g1_i10:56-544(-)
MDELAGLLSWLLRPPHHLGSSLSRCFRPLLLRGISTCSGRCGIHYACYLVALTGSRLAASAVPRTSTSGRSGVVESMVFLVAVGCCGGSTVVVAASGWGPDPGVAKYGNFIRPTDSMLDTRLRRLESGCCLLPVGSRLASPWSEIAFGVVWEDMQWRGGPGL